MARRTLRLPVIAILSVVTTGGSVPAPAWDGLNRFGMTRLKQGSSIHVPEASVRSGSSAPHHVGMRTDLRFHHPIQSRNGSPVAIWPDSAPFNTMPVQGPPPDDSEAPAGPSVTVMSDMLHNAPTDTVPETPPDFSYVAGCRAIPNGYHCDYQHEEAPR